MYCCFALSEKVDFNPESKLSVKALRSSLLSNFEPLSLAEGGKIRKGNRCGQNFQAYIPHTLGLERSQLLLLGRSLIPCQYGDLNFDRHHYISVRGTPPPSTAQWSSQYRN